MRSKVPVAQVVTMAVLVVGLGFGVWQVKQSQDIKKSEASYCAGCGTLGQCECSNGAPTGNMCLYAPDECKNLGLTWQPNSTCNNYANCPQERDRDPNPTPTENGRPAPSWPPTPTPVSGSKRKQTRPTPTPTPTPYRR